VQKITQQKLLPTELHFLTRICTKSFVGWSFAPDPNRGAYSAPPDPLAVFRAPTSKGREGENRKGRGWEGMDRRGDEGWGLSFALGKKESRRP